MQRRSLFLFPGAHKTGTTLLQQGLRLATPFLKENGFAVARRQRMYRSGLHQHILHGVEQIDDAPSILRGVFEDDNWANQNLVISLENIFGEALPRFYGGLTGSLDRLSNIFPSHDIKVCFYVRRQDEFVESLYLQYLHSGGLKTFDQYRKKFLVSKKLDWNSLVSGAELSVGKENVSVKPYDTLKTNPSQYMAEFFEQFCPLPKKLQRRIDKTVNTAFTNRSLSLHGVEVTLCAFKYIDRLADRKLFVRELREITQSMKQEKFSIPDTVRRQIAVANAPSNVALAQRMGLDGDLKSHYLFEGILGARSGEIPAKGS